MIEADEPIAEPEPRIIARDAWIKYVIRYHRADVTLRETLFRQFDRVIGRGEPRDSDVFWSLRGVSLTVRPGEVIGVIARNGSGKTTLLKTFAGIIAPDRGEVRVRGKAVCLLSFGAGFNANLSGRENIFLNGTLLGLRRQVLKERMDEIIEFSELGDFIHAPVRTYSTGMRSRLGFAIAVHVDPDVLILDEVLRAGDAHFQAKAGSLLERFKRKDKTIVIASHSMELVRDSCSRAIWMDQGEIRAAGEPKQVAAEYLEHCTEYPASPAPA